eukprot:SAG22_NODE_6704_length_821_cov_1.789474_2_plen_95_part_00
MCVSRDNKHVRVAPPEVVLPALLVEALPHCVRVVKGPLHCCVPSEPQLWAAFDLPATALTPATVVAGVRDDAEPGRRTLEIRELARHSGVDYLL